MFLTFLPKFRKGPSRSCRQEFQTKVLWIIHKLPVGCAVTSWVGLEKRLKQDEAMRTLGSDGPAISQSSLTLLSDTFPVRLLADLTKSKPHDTIEQKWAGPEDI